MTPVLCRLADEVYCYDRLDEHKTQLELNPGELAIVTGKISKFTGRALRPVSAFEAISPRLGRVWLAEIVRGSFLVVQSRHPTG